MQLTIDAALRSAAAQYREHPFLRFAAGDLSFQETDRRVEKTAHALRQMGVHAGSCVAILMPNRAEFVLAWFAANRLGATVVPINTQFRGPALARVLNTTAAPILIADPSLLGPVVAVAGELTALSSVVLVESAEVDGSDIVALQLPGEWQVTTWASITGSDQYDRPDRLPQASDPGDCALIMFTSGTTGPSKGCMLSNRFAVRQAELLVQHLELTSDDVLYCPFPLFHLDAAVLTVLPALVVGATAAVGARFSASGFWAEVRASRQPSSTSWARP